MSIINYICCCCKKKDNESKSQQKTNKQYKKLDYFTPKDIQEENKEITRIFQRKALDHIDDNEKTENETIAVFLIIIATVSRRAYNISNKLFINMFKEFSKYRTEDKIFLLQNMMII